MAEPTRHDETPERTPDAASKPMSDADTSAEATAPGGTKAAPPTDRASGRKGRDKRKKKEKKKYASANAYLWHEWIKPFAIIFAVLGTFRTALLNWNDVPSGSMEPSVLTGDRIGVHKWVYGLHLPFSKNRWIAGPWGEPDRGDIVVAYSPDPNDQVRVVKRVVGVPGDTLEVVNGRLVINGTPVEYVEADPEVAGRYLNAVTRVNDEFYEELLPTDREGDEDGLSPHFVKFTPAQPNNRDLPPVTLGAGEYFFMGDNRDESKDSRVYGIVPRERILGRAFGVAFSLDHDRFYLPRVSRFFVGLR